MGNPDLSIIINSSYAFIVRGIDYVNYSDAIKMASLKYEDFMRKSEGQLGEISEIKIYEIIG